MKIHSGDHKYGLTEIPLELLTPFAARAEMNHGQTLEKLNERGGLGLTEILDIMRNQRWGTHKNPIEALEFINAKIKLKEVNK